MHARCAHVHVSRSKVPLYEAVTRLRVTFVPLCALLRRGDVLGEYYGRGCVSVRTLSCVSQHCAHKLMHMLIVADLCISLLLQTCAYACCCRLMHKFVVADLCICLLLQKLCPQQHVRRELRAHTTLQNTARARILSDSWFIDTLSVTQQMRVNFYEYMHVII